MYYMIRHKLSLPLTMILAVGLLPACKKDQKSMLKRPEQEQAIMPLAFNNRDAISIFDEDVEAFVLEEDNLESPYDRAFDTDIALAQNMAVQDFTLEQLDTKDEMQTVYFPYDSQEPLSNQKGALKQTVQKAKEFYESGRVICCKGHSCKWHGTRAYNLALSMNRANKIARYLEEEAHIPKNRIKIFGVGNEEPVAFDETKDGQAPNRRVEIYALAV